MSTSENEEYGTMWLKAGQVSLDDASVSEDSESVQHQNLQINNEPLQLTSLPPEIFQHILMSYLSFDNIAKLRSVNQHFNVTCSAILNAEFSRLYSLMQQRSQQIKSQMPRRESARKKHPLARESDIIEALHTKLSLLQLTFGKRIEKKHCCFFAGGILDEVNGILNYVKNAPSLNRAYKVMDELFDLSTMAMEYFREHIETSLPEITYFAADFLDYTPLSPKALVPSLDDPLEYASVSNMRLGNELPSPSHAATDPKVTSCIRKMKESFRKNSNEVAVLKKSLKITRKKLASQQREIEQLRLQYRGFEKKFITITRRLNAASQELTRCKSKAQNLHSHPSDHISDLSDKFCDSESEELNCVSESDPFSFEHPDFDSNLGLANWEESGSSIRIVNNSSNPHSKKRVFLKRFQTRSSTACYYNESESSNELPDSKKMKLSNVNFVNSSSNVGKYCKESTFKFKNHTIKHSSLISAAEIPDKETSKPPLRRKPTSRFLRNLKRCDKTKGTASKNFHSQM